MKFIVQTPFKVRAVQGEVTLQPGQVINLHDDKALILIQQGKVSIADPEQQYAYQERAAIMQFNAGLPREEAEQYSWCKYACLLSYGQYEGMLPDHSDGCKVKTPCPKYTHNTDVSIKVLTFNHPRILTSAEGGY